MSRGSSRAQLACLANVYRVDVVPGRPKATGDGQAFFDRKTIVNLVEQPSSDLTGSRFHLPTRRLLVKAEHIACAALIVLSGLGSAANRRQGRPQHAETRRQGHHHAPRAGDAKMEAKSSLKAKDIKSIASDTLEGRLAARAPIRGELMRRNLLAALAATALAGCAAPVFEGGRLWSEGWREGEVEQVGTTREVGYQRFYDCRYRSGGGGRDALGRFAVVRVQNMGRLRDHVVPVEPGKEPVVGAAVLTNFRSCEPPVTRTTR